MQEAIRMRQITADAVSAFNNNRNFKRSNTEVRVIDEDLGIYHIKRTDLRLHGNLIAWKNNEGTFISTCGWNSVTTKERLNGLYGVNIYQKNFIWYLNGEAWNGGPIKIS
jgi:hypothetical protein